MYERSYHDRVLKEDKKHPPKKSIAWKKIGIILVTLLIVVGIGVLFRIPSFQVDTVEVKGVQVADPVDVSQFVLSQIQGSYVWVLPRSSILIISPERLAQQLSVQFPRFKSVVVRRASMHELTVTVFEFKNTYLWCDEFALCSFMDSAGVVFADAPYFSGNVYVKIYGGQRQPYPFNPIASPLIELISGLTPKLQSIDIDPVSFNFESDKKLSVAFVRYGARAEIYVDPTRDIERSLRTLYSGIESEPLRALYRSTSSVLEYIDLRFANKVIYKFK